MKKNLFYMAASVFVLMGCAQNDTTGKTPEAEKQGTSFVGTTAIKTGESPLSRTSLDYNRAANTLAYYWEPNDKIWLDDDNSAETDVTEKAATASFVFETGTYNAATYDVYYTGNNGTSHNAVTIATTQTQGSPNTTSHVGAGGDCGTGLATRQPNGRYTFTLTHRASYLCFLPRTTNATGTNWVLTGIKVTSDNNIAGSYTLTTTGLTGTGTSNTITLATGNFDITNVTTDQARNASYMVIAPGTHALTVEYSVRNTVSGSTGTITKTLDAKDYHANTLYPITAHLFEDYSGTKYYMWDAQEELWFGKTPIGNMTYNVADYPNRYIPTDANRYKHDNAPFLPGWTMPHGYGNQFQYATQTAKDCPNVFELAWIYDKGDVRWDGTTSFAFRGIIYRGGAWIKKLSVIAQENSTTVAALKNTYPGVHHGNTDDLVHPDANGGMGPEKSIAQGVPPAADINKYYYMPALGYYENTGGTVYSLFYIGTMGSYWSSSGYGEYQGGGWTLDFSNSTLHLNSIPYGNSPIWKAQ